MNVEKKKLVVLSGAGISAESGINTFRDTDGLWEGHDVLEVATPEGFKKNPVLVLDFYNQRRRHLVTVKPNVAHLLLAEMEEFFEVSIVTQNVDDLHERAGSSNILHLHGELLKSRSSKNENLVYDCKEDILLGDLCEIGSQLRPHIVWFREPVPLLATAAELVAEADFVVVVGSSMQVYPAAALVGFAPIGAEIYLIDPKPTLNYELEHSHNLTIINEKASVGMKILYEKLLKK